MIKPQNSIDEQGSADPSTLLKRWFNGDLLSPSEKKQINDLMAANLRAQLSPIWEREAA